MKKELPEEGFFLEGFIASLTPFGVNNPRLKGADYERLSRDVHPV